MDWVWLLDLDKRCLNMLNLIGLGITTFGVMNILKGWRRKTLSIVVLLFFILAFFQLILLVTGK